MLDKIQESKAFLEGKGIINPIIGIVLGTGLGQFVNEIEKIIEVDYKDIPYFPLSTVESHSGKLIFGTVNGKKVLAMQGRFHYYEGYSFQEITFPIRVMKALGIETLLLSNACGCLNLDWKKGELMLLDDHINLLPDNPLRGKNHDELGPRFPDMSAPYDKFINNKFKEIALKSNIILREGVYVAVMGPNLETRAEYKFLKIIGADVVGMSTIPEVIVANHMGLRCSAISVMTDECDPNNLKPVALSEILEVAGKAEINLTKLFVELIKSL